MEHEILNSIFNIKKILESKKQIILQGAPGTGKTYTTAEVAVLLCDGELPKDRSRTGIMQRYQQLEKEGRIGFTTFHQSMDYEQFVEGIVPVVDKEKGTMTYDVRDGIFKKMAKAATSNVSTSNVEDCVEDSNYEIDVDLATEAYNSILERTSKGEINWGKREAKTDNGNIKFVRNDGSLGDATTCDMILKILGQIPQKEMFETKYGCNVTRANVSGNTPNHTKVLKQMFELHDSYIKGNGEVHKETKAEKSPYVLIIDEINRGNISKILGELITLLEVDKRQGMTNEVKATLPYSQEEFSVPSNLYIIGTMNTADRSVGYIDYAVRRRFAFYTIKADEEVIRKYYKSKNDSSLQEKALNMFGNIKKHFTQSNTSSEVEADDIMVGHSYFLAKDEEELKFKYEYEIKPLLKEYHSDGLITEKYEKTYDEVIKSNNDNV